MLRKKTWLSGKREKGPEGDHSKSSNLRGTFLTPFRGDFLVAFIFLTVAVVFPFSLSKYKILQFSSSRTLAFLSHTRTIVVRKRFRFFS